MALTWWPVAVVGFACLAVAVALAVFVPTKPSQRQLRPLANTTRLTRLPEYARVARACEEAGRDPDDVTRSAMTGVLIAETEADLRDRVRAQLGMTGAAETDADAWLAERRRRWIMGTLDEAGERVAALEAAGVQRIMLQDFRPRDLDMVRLMPRLAA